MKNLIERIDIPWSGIGLILLFGFLGAFFSPDGKFEGWQGITARAFFAASIGLSVFYVGRVIILLLITAARSDEHDEE